MENKPLVSILMGIYNCADTLEEAVESIKNQTYDNWELIMCDDGSSDNTYEIAKKYADEDPEKFILIKNEKNMGLNMTLNNCLKVAKGDFIARMDGDDISLPERFEKEVNFLLENPEYAIVSTPMHYFDKDGIFRTGKGGGAPKKEDLVKGTPHCHAPCMVRHEAYKSVNGYSVDDKLLRVEDYHLWIKMYEVGYRGYNLSEALYKMRDDRNATKRRKFRYRLNEAYVRYLAVKKLKLKKIYLIYMLRPVLVGILPTCIYTFIHKKHLKGN